MVEKVPSLQCVGDCSEVSLLSVLGIQNHFLLDITSNMWLLCVFVFVSKLKTKLKYYLYGLMTQLKVIHTRTHNKDCFLVHIKLKLMIE